MLYIIVTAIIITRYLFKAFTVSFLLYFHLCREACNANVHFSCFVPINIILVRKVDISSSA